MAKNDTPDFEDEDTSALDNTTVRESAIAKLDAILGKSPNRLGSGIDMTPQTPEEERDDRRIRMEERRRLRNARIHADLSAMRKASEEGPKAPKPEKPARKDNAIFQRLREADAEPDFEPDTPSIGGSSSASEAGEWFRSNPQAVEDLRAMGRAIDPNAAAIHRARTQGRGTHFDFGGKEHMGSLDPMAASRAEDIVGNENIGGGGGVMSFENAAISTDYDPADYNPRLFGGPAFAEPAKIASPFESYKETATPEQRLALNAGLLYLRQAGRCDHPLCKQKRARGLQLMGKPVSRRSFNEGVESDLPPIPSVATEKKYYREDPKTGKQDRKNPATYLDIQPADPKSVEWKDAQSFLDTREKNFLMPEDLLEHHHGPEDMDFKRHLPWLQD